MSTAQHISSRPAADRCPGVLRLHDAGDGGLARVRVPGGLLTAGQLDALAAGAALGNSLAELTSRASVQLRGLPRDAAGALARVLADGGLLPSAAHDRVRNVLASPLAERTVGSLLPTDPLVAAFDAALCADQALAALPGRFLFAFDDGAGLVDLAACDVALAAEAAASGASAAASAGAAPDGDRSATTGTDDPRFRLHLAGASTSLTVAPGDAVALLLQAAHAFLALRASLAPTAWHVADLPDGAVALAAALGARPRPDAAAPRALRRVLPGPSRQADGRFAVTALAPLAQLDRAQLAGLAALLRGERAETLRLSTARTLTIVDLPPGRVEPVSRALTALGLVVAPGSGWQGLTACSGVCACRRALVDVHAAATARAARRGPGSPSEHWSACGRRCGMKRDVGIGVVAGDDTLALTRAGAAHGEAADIAHALELLDTTIERAAA